MNRRTILTIGLAFAGLILPPPQLAFAADFAWKEIPGGRSAELTIPANGRTGFALVLPERSGLPFTNSVDEAAAAANRVLYNGSGVAAGDFDSDGLPDLYFCSLNGRNTLYRNLGGWRFADVTTEAGLKRDSRYYRGAVFADINGDGAVDLLVGINGGGVECFLNDGRGKFTDATAMARTLSRFASTTLALADVDGNGTLDLYIANNRTDDIRDRGQVNLRLVNGQMAVPPELKDRLVLINGQLQEYGEPDQLFLNDGKGRFTPVSWTGGRFRNEDGGPLAEPPLDWGLTATFRDINGDGFPDLYVCNDFWTPDRVWMNDGKGRFRAAPWLAWRNSCASSMGVDFADIDRDGDMDCYVVDMLSRDLRLRRRQKLAQSPMASPIGVIEDRPQFMRNTLFENRGDGTFAEIANYAGVAASEWAWSPVFLDVDLDGFEDLLITSGHAKDVQDLDAAAQIRARQHSWKGFANEAERQKAFTKELMEHMRFYPQLDTPVVAFRNRGDGRFDDVTTQWGTDQPAVHHAMASADFDQDGDFDLAVNNLGSAAGLYRNETTAARVAVRLRGLPPNTQGIGAKVRLLGGAVPSQSLEVISGGRYMAGSDPMVVFAAGQVTKGMTLEVIWRNGQQSRIADVSPNRIYEISEVKAVAGALPAEVKTVGQAISSKPRAALFEDVSQRLQHTHHEEAFDDFQRQPLLPRRLSQLGPGVSWFDVDGDGWEDLIIGSGKGGKLNCYRNDGQGGFQRVTGSPWDSEVTRDQTTILGLHDADGKARLLVGSANYEDGLTNGSSVVQFDLVRRAIDEMFPDATSSTGPMAQADFDADGDLDLFFGGRVLPGRYPEPASSRLYRNEGAQFKIDTANSKLLENIGLVSGAVWSDLDGDGFPELVLACEWGPLKVFHNRKGELLDATTKLGLDRFTGWWNGVTTGDLDGDGRLDIVASNWGLNSEYAATSNRPVVLYHGDFLQRGSVDLIETEWDSHTGILAPRRRLDVLGQILPSLQARYPSHRSFSETSAADVVGPFQSQARNVEAAHFASTVFFNRGNRFEAVPMPREAQLAPAFGVCVADFDGDGNEDVFLSQNFFATAVETPRLDAGRGLLLRGNGQGALEALSGRESGIAVYGEQRGTAVVDYDADGRTDLAVAQNGAATKLFHNASAKPGLRVKVAGSKGNPTGVGATLRLQFGSRLGPAREIHSGSGYWSQESATPVLGLPEKPTGIWVRWPGGQELTVAVPLSAREVIVHRDGVVR